MPKYRSKIAAAVHESLCNLYKAGGIDQKTIRKFDALCLIPPREAQMTKSPQSAQSAEPFAE